jgi:hypothetical protein
VRPFKIEVSTPERTIRDLCQATKLPKKRRDMKNTFCSSAAKRVEEFEIQPNCRRIKCIPQKTKDTALTRERNKAPTGPSNSKSIESFSTGPQ